jgi:hypothetical protein
MLEERIAQMSTPVIQVESTPSAPPPPLTQFDTFTWGGKMNRYTPADFIFPTETAKTMWQLWHFGHSERRIRPYKLLRDHRHIDEVAREVNGIRRRCPAFSKAAKIMDLLGQLAIRERLVANVEDITNLGYLTGDSIFDQVYPRLIEALFPNKAPARPFEIKYTTLYNEYSRTNPAI